MNYVGSGVGGAIQAGVDQWTPAQGEQVRLDLVDALAGSGGAVVRGPGASVASEVALYDGTTGKLIKRATGTGYAKLVSGVLQAPAATVPLATDVSGNLPLANLPTNFAQLFRATVSLTDANIKALPTTAITLVAAPAAGLTLVPNLVLLLSKVTAAAYTNVNADGFLFAQFGSDVWSNYVANDSGNSVTYLSDFLGNVNHRAVLREYSDTTDPTPQWGPLAVPGPRGDATALSLKIDNGGSGNLTGGNAANSITAVIYYSVESVP